MIDSQVSVMTKVLIVSSSDMTPELGRTILWRSDIERVFSPNAESALRAAAEVRPRLVVVDGTDTRAATAILKDLRRLPDTAQASLAVVSRRPSMSLAEEDALRRAGANVVLTGPVDASLWDWRFEGLLAIPRRKELRIPVRFAVSSDLGGAGEPVQGLALNVSQRGLLLESVQPLDVGTQIELALEVAEPAGILRAMGRVVWEMGNLGGRCHSGVEFVSLRDGAREKLRTYIEELASH